LDELQQLCTWAYEELDDDFKDEFDKTDEKKAWTAKNSVGFQESQLKDMANWGKQKAPSVKKVKARIHEGLAAFSKLLVKFEDKDPQFMLQENEIMKEFLTNPNQKLDAHFYRHAVDQSGMVGDFKYYEETGKKLRWVLSH
jgi:hypothetical protein